MSGNRASAGGAIAGDTPYDARFSNQLTISDSTLTGNVATSSYFGGGGALFAGDLRLTISNSMVLGNHAAELGGGFLNHGSSEIINSTFSENTADSGGAVFNTGGLTISGSTFHNNEATDSGGGIVNGRWLVLTNSTLSGNTAGQVGGSVFNSYTATITNSTLTGNSAQRGGGIYNWAGFLCDFACSPFYGTVTLTHSLVSGNVVYNIGRELFNGTGTYQGAIVNGVVEADNYNLFGFSSDPGFVNVSVQPLDIVPDEPLEAILDPLLADNGGPTLTHHLPENSPALDIASNEACNADPVNGVDQRGWQRNVNQVGETSDNDCDIGAFELQNIYSLFAR